jgi:hypothetical protein
VKVVLHQNDVEGLRHVARHMREWDRREIFARRWSDDPESIVRDVTQAGFPWWVAYVDGEPVSAIGAMHGTPGAWFPWCFGTEGFAMSALALTRLARRVIMPAVRNSGGHRMEVKSIDGHTDAQRWLERSFGARREGTHPRAGKGGETFHTYGLEL